VALAIAVQSPAPAADTSFSKATALRQQAVALLEQGRYHEAELLAKQVLEILEKTLGPKHPYFAVELSDLALIYEKQNRYAEAESLYKRSLALAQKALGAEHPNVAATLNNLGGLYKEQGRYAEAEPLYKRALAIDEKTLGPNHPNVAATLNNLAGLYTDQARYAEAETLYKRALGIAEKALGAENPNIAALLDNLAGLYRDQGRSAEAEPLQKRALAVAEKALGPDHPDVAKALNNLASLYKSQARYGEAEPLFKRALQIWEKALGPDHALLATSLNNLAGLYEEQTRYTEAELIYKRALVIREKALGPYHSDVAGILNNLAGLYREQGRYAEAEPLYKRAQTIWEKAFGTAHPNVATVLNNLASLYQTQGRYSEAESLYTRALAIIQKALGRDHPDVARSLNNLAMLYLDDDHPERAVPASARAVEIMTKQLSIGFARRSGNAVAEQRSDRFFFSNYITIANAAASKAPERQPTTAAETFQVVQTAQASTAGAAVAALAARFAAGNGSSAAMIRDRQDLAQQWQGLDEALVKAVGRAPTDRQPGEEALLRAALEDATRRLDRLDGQIAAQFPDYAELSNPKPLPAEAARALLAPDEALLVYLVTDRAVWLWVLRRDNLAFYRIDIGAKALADEVTALRERLEPDSNHELLPFPAARAYALYQKLIGPAGPILAGVHHLLIVPDGALQSLPMTVLVTKTAQQDSERLEDHRDIAWLARDYAVTVLPAVSSLRALRQFANSEHASAPFLGVGDPVLNGIPASMPIATLASLWRGAIVNVEAVRALPPLPQTAEELHAIARTLGAADTDLLLGERASEPVLRQTPLDHYRVVAFATHGLMSGELKGLAEPALVLTPPAEATAENDGLLTASKIATLKFNADWVVLSACNTAAGDGTPDAGGLSGLAKAFFYAGARSLLVSHWPVRSDAAVKLTTGAFAALAKDPTIGRAEALRRSMMAMLDRANPPEFAHPLYWASFVLAGEGGAAR
jgi:CHAT domain-containing protein/Tfp pilus assembly protein PilF